MKIAQRLNPLGIEQHGQELPCLGLVFWSMQLRHDIHYVQSQKDAQLVQIQNASAPVLLVLLPIL
jgi:hypothetical protein